MTPPGSSGQIMTAFQPQGTTTEVCELLNKSAEGSTRKVVNHICMLGCSWTGSELCQVPSVVSYLWTRQGVNTGMPIISNGITSVVTGCRRGCSLSLRIRHYDDNVNTCLQGDNLTVRMTISSNICEQHFRVGWCLGGGARNVFPPG